MWAFCLILFIFVFNLSVMIKVTSRTIKLKAKVLKPKAALWLSGKFSKKAAKTDEKKPISNLKKVDDDCVNIFD